ncbi:hypothetical protein ACFPOE_10235 [Caenimonas terrae]|uniref:Uncharacterized protein n=1 Tax=Caenimonas terrae TaxID=696074 RepID=A0ABW0NBI4_9BURK
MNSMDSSVDADATVIGSRRAAPREGFTPELPVKIAANTPMAGVPAEYAWLEKTFGAMERDWKVDLRSLGRNSQGRTIETFRLRLAGGTKVDVHFDISGFHQLG